MIRIGVDVGGTKLEAIAIDERGAELARRRVASPSASYPAMVEAVRDLVVAIENDVGATARVGLGTPGAVSPASGLMKNANSVVLNGRPFRADVASALQRNIRIANDANCFALSEAIDGAGAGRNVVFGVILGTGVGGGIVVGGRPWVGANAIAGKWGHNEMPSRGELEGDVLHDLACYCGRRRCVELYLSGPGLAADHERVTGARDDGRGIAARAESGEAPAVATLTRYVERLAAALASVVNVVDPDVIVLGGGVSRIDALYPMLAARLPSHVFSDACVTTVVKNRHGDSSGVRGAAWLWSAGGD